MYDEATGSRLAQSHESELHSFLSQRALKLLPRESCLKSTDSKNLFVYRIKSDRKKRRAVLSKVMSRYQALIFRTPSIWAKGTTFRIALVLSYQANLRSDLVIS
jgi:hypothetical protein